MPSCSRRTTYEGKLEIALGGVASHWVLALAGAGLSLQFLGHLRPGYRGSIASIPRRVSGELVDKPPTIPDPSIQLLAYHWGGMAEASFSDM